MRDEKRCPIDAINHGGHFWSIDGRPVRIQPSPGVFWCPGADRDAEPFQDPTIAEQLTFPT